jgi:hypothetical protein
MSNEARIALERVARLAATAALGGLILQAIWAQSASRMEDADTRSLAAATVRWTTSSDLAAAHVRVDGPVSPIQRDWLAAISGAGTRVTWDGTDVLPLAAAADASADPRGGVQLWAAAPAGAMVRVRDESGVFDSVRVRGDGARFSIFSPSRVLGVRAGALAARTPVSDSVLFRAVLVLGHADWESKFVIDALEERGWPVAARLIVSPRRSIVQGTVLPIDTARFSAVIALDTSIRNLAPEIARYVGSGGGLLMSAQVASAKEFDSLSTGSFGGGIPAIGPFDSAEMEPQRSLGLVPVVLSRDAIALEARRGLVAVAARRVARGRVVTIGYADTWRWRMAGGSDGERRHREWWAALVASVARVGRVPKPQAATPDEAPLASLIERLGAPSRTAGLTVPRQPWVTSLLFGLFVLALLIEWGSRRLRGAA